MSKLHVFVDANILLSFFAFTSDDLEQLRKLVGLMKSGHLTLYFTSQVRDEFERNREAKLNASIRHFEKEQIKSGVPRFMEAYPQAKDYADASSALDKAKNALIKAAREDAVARSLSADKLVSELFANADVLETDPSSIERAELRHRLGNPPGKPSSIGDQLNWEILLQGVPNMTNLHIVSKDSDFRSLLTSGPQQFLIDEWMSRKSGSLFLHEEIKPFLNANFPHIKLAIDIEKQKYLGALIESMSFANTHSAIAKLWPFIDLLTLTDVKSLAEAAINNTQIRMISSDPDVESFFQKAVVPQLDALDLDTAEQFKWHFSTNAPPVSEDELPDEIPF